MSLPDCLRDPPEDGLRREYLAAVLASPWCWPADPELERAALAADFEPPPPPSPGEVLLVSVSGARTALWRLAPEGRAHPDDRELVGAGRQAAERAWRLAARDMPVIRDLRPLADPGLWRARTVACLDDPHQEATLAGESFGLGLWLASASRLLDTPVPADVAALGRLDDHGCVHAVDGLGAKLRVLAEWAVGVRTVLVAMEQQQEATAIASDLAPRLRVIGVSSVAEALARAFPGGLEGLLELASRQWHDERRRADEALDALYQQALDNQALLLGWAGVASAAEILADVLADDPARASAARFVLQVARRHDGHTAPIAWPDRDWLAGQHRPVRLQIVAHVLQAATDSGDPELMQAITRAREHLAPPVERHREDLMILGAIGRAQALGGRLEQAASTLLDAIDGWRGIRRIHEASYALSECLRVLGLLQRPDDLRALLDGHAAAFLRHPEAAPLSRCFVALAAARGLIEAQRPVEGMAWLEDDAIPWAAAVRHADAARLRWRARALSTTGKTDAAAELRAQLERQHGAGTPPEENVLLARIDAALESGTDPVPPLRDLLALGEPLVRVVLGPTAPGAAGQPTEAAARTVARLYPY